MVNSESTLDETRQALPAGMDTATDLLSCPGGEVILALLPFPAAYVGRQRRCRAANADFARVWGVKPGSLRGRFWGDVTRVPDSLREPGSLSKLFGKPMAGAHGEAVVIPCDMEPYRRHLIPLHGEDGAWRGFLDLLLPKGMGPAASLEGLHAWSGLTARARAKLPGEGAGAGGPRGQENEKKATRADAPNKAASTGEAVDGAGLAARDGRESGGTAVDAPPPSTTAPDPAPRASAHAEHGHTEQAEQAEQAGQEDRACQGSIDCRLRLLADDGFDLIAELTDQGAFAYANQVHECILGLSPLRLIGQPALDRVQTEDQARVRAALRECLDCVGSTVRVAAYRYRHADGHWVWLESGGRSYRTREGSTRVLITSRDVSDQKHAEEALLRTERLAAVGTLAAGVAHQFNNLNGPILGYTDLLLRRDDLDEKARGWVEMMHTTALRARSITDNLLAFSQLRTTMRGERAQVGEVLQRVLSLLEGELQTQGIEVECKLGGMPRPLMNENELSQVLVNLLTNAIHALIDRPHRKITIESGLLDGRIHLSISDTGCGIPRAHLPRLFSPFFCTKGEFAEEDAAQRKAKGAGLGLSVCHTLVTNRGGEISVQSVEDLGTVVTLWLPVREKGETEIVEAEAPSMACSVKGDVLLLDDDDLGILVARDILESAGYAVVDIDDGAEALACLKERRFDVVLVDLQMPKMHGAVFLHHLFGLAPSIRPRPIVVTGRLTDDNLEAIAATPPFRTLAKPFAAEELLQAVADGVAARRAI